LRLWPTYVKKENKEIYWKLLVEYINQREKMYKRNLLSYVFHNSGSKYIPYNLYDYMLKILEECGILGKTHNYIIIKQKISPQLTYTKFRDMVGTPWKFWFILPEDW
jgi:hypothetical protein